MSSRPKTRSGDVFETQGGAHIRIRANEKWILILGSKMVRGVGYCPRRRGREFRFHVARAKDELGIDAHFGSAKDRTQK